MNHINYSLWSLNFNFIASGLSWGLWLSPLTTWAGHKLRIRVEFSQWDRALCLMGWLLVSCLLWLEGHTLEFLFLVEWSVLIVAPGFSLSLISFLLWSLKLKSLNDFSHSRPCPDVWICLTNDPLRPRMGLLSKTINLVGGSQSKVMSWDTKFEVVWSP